MSDGTAARWRGMTLDDHPAVERVAERVHRAYPEDPGVFAERRHLYPDGCLVLARDAALLGYTIAHPWLFARPPGLNTMLGRLPEAPDTFYIHDLALLPQTRASGAGAAVVRLLADRARALGVATMALIAVGRSHGFWERQGFAVHDDAALHPKLASYGDSARFMMRTLA